METIKVNMTPCEDIKTIHASQNDNEGREWGFELHNNGDVIDASEVTDQLVFKAYEGGTEQILPENGSTPTTSPFKGDIKYPQGLLSDQEFLYRESPTEEDGLAKITDIKGNTLVWNQLIQNGNFADTSNWSAESGVTFSVSNSIATISSTTANNGIRQSFLKPLTVNHKYLVKAEFNVPLECRCVVGTAGSQGVQIEKLVSTPNTWTEVIGIGTCTVATTAFYCFVRGTTYENVKVRNVMCFDLTQMGLDISNPSDFTSLFNLPYYAYNQGTLLSFNGNGIKTVGKNLVTGISQGAVGSHGETASHEKRLRVDGFVRVFQGEHYTFTATSNSGKTLQIYTRYFADADGSEQVSYLDWLNLPRSVIIPSGVNYATFTIRFGNNTDITPNDVFDVQIEHGTTPSSYEPYTSSTLSLPISTYFPNGMDGVGTDYDELTNTKATTRMTRVDLGSLYWNRMAINEGYAFVSNSISNMIPTGNVSTANVLCPSYTLYMTSNGYYMPNDKTYRVGGSYFGMQRVIIRDDSYTDATTFKSAMSGVYLVYPLATPIETSFTTASLVTENTEIPLSNEDGTLIGKCTEQLSSESGFFDAKIKLADDDGECYSNKIQLHIERSPQ